MEVRREQEDDISGGFPGIDSAYGHGVRDRRLLWIFNRCRFSGRNLHDRHQLRGTHVRRDGAASQLRRDDTADYLYRDGPAGRLC